MKVKATIDIACSSCKRTDVKFRARGVCHNCYQSWYYKNRLKPAGITYHKPNQTVKDVETS